MRKAALAGLFAFVAILAASSSRASAETLDILHINKQTNAATILRPIVLASSESKKTDTAVQTTISEVKIHVVQPNENLTSIAMQYQTTWQRLFDKNTQIAQPDILQIGDKITIPEPGEVIKEREAQIVNTAVSKSVVAGGAVTVARGVSAGNTYTPGYCTWYAKNMRPDLPNNLGNADTWVSRAAAQGISTGSMPAPGAIGQQGMHVVYVERVNPDGTVFISEMNFTGLYAISTRTVAASTFRYIY